MDNVTNNTFHRSDCLCAVCTTGIDHQRFVRDCLRSLFTPGLTFAYKITPVRSGGYIALLTFIGNTLDAITVCETFRSHEQAERWISVAADAADSVVLSSGGLCNTATLSPAGEFSGKSAC